MGDDGLSNHSHLDNHRPRLRDLLACNEDLAEANEVPLPSRKDRRGREEVNYLANFLFRNRLLGQENRHSGLPSPKRLRAGRQKPESSPFKVPGCRIKSGMTDPQTLRTDID